MYYTQTVTTWLRKQCVTHRQLQLGYLNNVLQTVTTWLRKQCITHRQLQLGYLNNVLHTDSYNLVT